MTRSGVIHGKVLVHNDNYRYLWLKVVTGFDPDRHCAKCLIGTYVRPLVPFPWQAKVEGVTRDANVCIPMNGALYLCGVWHPPDWNKNLHVLMRPAKGEVVEVDTPGIRARFTDAEQIAIPALPTTFPDELAALGLRAGKSFTTCRNYQAGFMLFGQGLPAMEEDRKRDSDQPSLF